MDDQIANVKVRKLQYKFDVIFVLVFLAISILGQLYIRHTEYEGGLANQGGCGLLPMLYFLAAELILLVFYSICFIVRVFLSTRTVKNILIKITYVVMPFAIFFGSFMITIPLTPVFLKGFEKWVLKEVDINAIQQWLATEGQQYKCEYFTEDFPKEFPAFLTKNKPYIIIFENSELDNTRYIDFRWGGGMDSWGLRIGSPSMKMPEQGMLKIREGYYEFRRPIAPGVYVFEGG